MPFVKETEGSGEKKQRNKKRLNERGPKGSKKGRRERQPRKGNRKQRRRKEERKHQWRVKHSERGKNMVLALTMDLKLSGINKVRETTYTLFVVLILRKMKRKSDRSVATNVACWLPFSWKNYILQWLLSYAKFVLSRNVRFFCDDYHLSHC